MSGCERTGGGCPRLNESPSEKEGKSPYDSRIVEAKIASMKVPPKRKGNQHA